MDKQAEFGKRIDALCNLTASQLGTYSNGILVAFSGRNLVTDAIDDIKAFVEAS